MLFQTGWSPLLSLDAVPHVRPGLLFHPSSHCHCHSWAISGSLSPFCPIFMEPIEYLSHPCTPHNPWVEPEVGLMRDGSHSSPVSLALQRPASPTPVCWLFSIIHWPLRVLPKKFLVPCLLRTSLLGNLWFFPWRAGREAAGPKLFDSVAQAMVQVRWQKRDFLIDANLPKLMQDLRKSPPWSPDEWNSFQSDWDRDFPKIYWSVTSSPHSSLPWQGARLEKVQWLILDRDFSH